MNAAVLSLCIGQPRPLADGKISSIDKHAVDGLVAIEKFGLVGDTQSDRKHHGGEHMAVHHYPAQYYSDWRHDLPGVTRLSEPGAFGENLYAAALTETDVHIGDRFRFGSALLEVSMGRQPCSTLARHFQRKDMIERVLQNGRCGWYYRVLETGTAQAGDALQRVAVGSQDWTIARAFAVLFDKKRRPSRSELSEMAALPALGPIWRNKIAAKLR